MNCPGCNKNHASLLSVCPSCGTMINDSVREELALKISPRTVPVKMIIEEKPMQEIVAAPPQIETPLKIELAAEPISVAPIIEQRESGLPTEKFSKPKQTSPILVEFQNKNAVIPEWRLQLQNSVRRRNSGQVETSATVQPKVLVTSGATALKAETIEQPVAAPATASNPTLEKALERIEKSRRQYFAEEKPKPAFPATQKTFPYVVANRSQSFPLTKFQDADNLAVESMPNTPTAFNPAKAEKFDTNKLPPLPAKVATAFERTIEIPSKKIVEREENFLQIKAEEMPDVMAYTETAIDASEAIIENVEIEGDDRAPMMMRFNAGFFDLIIGAFTSFILLAPFTLASGNLFTFQGLLAFLATCSIVMFIYLTATIGTMGRTFGMKIFSLEIIDIEENDYPTFHQAAVSSSVYLASLALGGIGFLTLFLNDENRAAHDLISGTIVVKEYE